MLTEENVVLAKISEQERVPLVELKELISCGKVVILNNPRHKESESCAVGKNLSTKINVNLGVSPRASDLDEELQKLNAAIRLGADTIMDLSLGDNMDEVRNSILRASKVPVGTVPIYQAAYQVELNNHLENMKVADIFEVIQKHAEDGVDFITVHTGLTRKALEHVRKDRVLGVVSRGGSILASWMYANKKENPLYENYDQLLELARQYDLALSLGDGLRPGCIADGSDRAQFDELITLGELTRRALESGVKVIVEGPGHIMLNEVTMNVEVQKKLCHEVPFYILGPLVTDIAPGYDHITSAIGSAIAGASGADFICCVSPAEHLGLPDLRDIEEGTVAGKIAAHAADLVKGHKKALQRDLEMAQARKELDWSRQFSLALDSERAQRIFHMKNSTQETGCTMCGDMCAIRIYQEGEERDALERCGRS